MQKLFDPDGGFSHFITRLSQLIWLNILFLVCSLPVVTFGASSAALYTVLLRLLQGEDGHLTRRFFAAWRDNWKRASGCWLLLLIVIAVCGADLWLAHLEGAGRLRAAARGHGDDVSVPAARAVREHLASPAQQRPDARRGEPAEAAADVAVLGRSHRSDHSDARHALRVPASVAVCGVRRAELRKPQADLADLQPDRGAAAPRKRGAGQEHGRR